MLFVEFPLFSAFGVVVDLRLLNVLGLEGCDHMECIFQIGHLADRVFEACDLDQLLHPCRPTPLENGKEGLLSHAHRHLSED